VDDQELHVEGRLQLRNYEDRKGQKRNVREVIVTAPRFLGPANNGNCAKAAKSSEAAEPVDEGDNPLSSSRMEQGIPF
jgi:single-stranded DNA-binding protein